MEKFTGILEELIKKSGNEVKNIKKEGNFGETEKIK